MRLSAHGVTVDAPPGWEARIQRHPTDDGSTSNPVLHAATFPLPNRRGDFGTGAVERMKGDDVLVVLFEYDPEAVRTALFGNRGRPRPRPVDFHPQQLQRTLPGQSGCQWFYAESNRAFCLYIVLGSHANRVRLVPAAQQLLDTVSVRPGGTTW